MTTREDPGQFDRAGRFGRGVCRVRPNLSTQVVADAADIRRLPRPVTDDWDWQLRGACRGMDSSFFFHPKGERGLARARREVRAKQVCRSCPVIEQCRRQALSSQEPYGVWGGLSESEREDLIRGHGSRPSTPSAYRARSGPSPQTPGSAWNNHAGPGYLAGPGTSPEQ